jgi:SAM-dependent methyltransferase
MTVKSSGDLRTVQDIESWLARLNREWPQRAEVAQHIANQVSALPGERLQVVELACGSGYLAGWLLRMIPNIRYIGFDRSQHLLEFARRHVAILAGQVDGQPQIHLHEADLNQDLWVNWLRERALAGQVDAVVSLQSIHDLGDEEAQFRAYRRVRTVLRVGGIFVNGDLLFDPDTPHPRRLPAHRHLDLLREAGFAHVNCTLQLAEFGVFVAQSAGEDAHNGDG